MYVLRDKESSQKSRTDFRKLIDTDNTVSILLYMNFTPDKQLCDHLQQVAHVTIKFWNTDFVFAETPASKKRLLQLHSQVPLGIMTEEDVQKLIQDIFLTDKTRCMLKDVTKKPVELIERYLGKKKNDNASPMPMAVRIPRSTTRSQQTILTRLQKSLQKMKIHDDESQGPKTKKRKI